MLRTHVLLQRITAGGASYRRGEISIEALARIVSANLAALEGDVPTSVRTAVEHLDAEIDSARFSLDEGPQTLAISEAFTRLQTAMDDADRSSSR